MPELNFRSFIIDSSIHGFYVFRYPHHEWGSLNNYYSIIRYAKIENSLIIMNEHDEHYLQEITCKKHLSNSKNKNFLATNNCWKMNHVKSIRHFELELKALKNEMTFTHVFITCILNFNLTEEPGNHFPIIYTNLFRIASELSIKIILFQQLDDSVGTITFKKYIGDLANSKMYDVQMGSKGLILVEV